MLNLNRKEATQFIFLLILCLLSYLSVAQDTIIRVGEDSLFVSYYDEYDYVTDEAGNEYITHHDDDYEYSTDADGAPVQVCCTPNGWGCHYIYYGQPDFTVFEMFRGTQTRITYTSICFHCKQSLSIQWDCKKDCGWLNDSTVGYCQRLFKGLQGRNHLIHKYFRELGFDD